VSKIFSKASSKNFVDPLNNCLLKLLKSRKEVEINGNGTHGYRIKEGIHKGTVVGHIIREKSVLEN